MKYDILYYTINSGPIGVLPLFHNLPAFQSLTLPGISRDFGDYLSLFSKQAY